jgi:hypothetical protein
MRVYHLLLIYSFLFGICIGQSFIYSQLDVEGGT